MLGEGNHVHSVLSTAQVRLFLLLPFLVSVLINLHIYGMLFFIFLCGLLWCNKNFLISKSGKSLQKSYPNKSVFNIILAWSCKLYLSAYDFIIQQHTIISSNTRVLTQQGKRSRKMAEIVGVVGAVIHDAWPRESRGRGCGRGPTLVVHAYGWPLWMRSSTFLFVT